MVWGRGHPRCHPCGCGCSPLGRRRVSSVHDAAHAAECGPRPCCRQAARWLVTRCGLAVSRTGTQLMPSLWGRPHAKAALLRAPRCRLCSCLSGCKCDPPFQVIDARHDSRTSTIFLARALVTQHPQCTLGVTVLDKTTSGEHKFKVHRGGGARGAGQGTRWGAVSRPNPQARTCGACRMGMGSHGDHSSNGRNLGVGVGCGHQRMHFPFTPVEAPTGAPLACLVPCRGIVGLVRRGQAPVWA